MVTGFIFLNDPGSKRQWLLRGDHISAAEVRREDGIVLLHLLNGEELLLTHEESKQFVHHAHPQKQTDRAGAQTDRPGSP